MLSLQETALFPIGIYLVCHLSLKLSDPYLSQLIEFEQLRQCQGGYYAAVFFPGFFQLGNFGFHRLCKLFRYFNPVEDLGHPVHLGQIFVYTNGELLNIFFLGVVLIQGFFEQNLQIFIFGDAADGSFYCLVIAVNAAFRPKNPDLLIQLAVEVPPFSSFRK